MSKKIKKPEVVLLETILEESEIPHFEEPSCFRDVLSIPIPDGFLGDRITPEKFAEIKAYEEAKDAEEARRASAPIDIPKTKRPYVRKTNAKRKTLWSELCNKYYSEDKIPEKGTPDYNKLKTEYAMLKLEKMKKKVHITNSSNADSLSEQCNDITN